MTDEKICATVLDNSEFREEAIYDNGHWIRFGRVDQSVTSESTNAVSSAAVFKALLNTVKSINGFTGNVWLTAEDIENAGMAYSYVPSPDHHWNGKIIQYTGDDYDIFKQGYFYRCRYNADADWYEWVQIDVQPSAHQYDNQNDIPTGVENVGKIIQYVGPTTSDFQNGYFFIGSIDAHGDFVWEQIDVQPEVKIDNETIVKNTDDELSVDADKILAAIPYDSISGTDSIVIPSANRVTVESARMSVYANKIVNLSCSIKFNTTTKASYGTRRAMEGFGIMNFVAGTEISGKTVFDFIPKAGEFATCQMVVTGDSGNTVSTAAKQTYGYIGSFRAGNGSTTISMVLPFGNNTASSSIEDVDRVFRPNADDTFILNMTWMV